MSHRKFIFFINPISGSGNKKVVLRLIHEMTGAKNIPYEILHTNPEADYSYLIKKIDAEKISDVIICGGDGTVNQVVASLLDTNINIGIIPMGSGNGLALSAGIPRNPKKALETIFAGNYALIDGFRVNGQFSCMLCGIGFDGQVAHEFAQSKTRGLLTYTKLTWKNFLKATPYPFQLIINNTVINTNAFFISVANSNQFGNHVTIAPKASLQDGLLDIVIVNRMSKLTLLYNLLKQIKFGIVQQLAGNNDHPTHIQYLQTENLTIHNPSLAPMHIDGEAVATVEHISVSIIAKAFRLLQP